MDLTSRTLDRIVLSETCRELKGAVISAAAGRGGGPDPGHPGEG